MLKNKIRLTDTVFLISIIFADVFIFLLLGLSLMGYDDNYDHSKGEYWSLESMLILEKVLYLSYNLWIILNIIGVFFLFKKPIFT